MTPPPFAIPVGLEDLLPAFIAEMTKDAARLQALAEGDRLDLAEHAHAMRGKCAMFGDDVLFGHLTRLEGAADAAEIARIILLIVDRTVQLAALP